MRARKRWSVLWCVIDGTGELVVMKPTRALARERVRVANARLPGFGPFIVVKYVPVTRKGGGA